MQVFGWVNSNDLAEILDRVKPGRRPDFDQRVILAKRLMGGMTALHAAKIVHADLKPENLLLIEDPSIRSGYKLKLIDMDYSVLSDKTAPWDDDPNTEYVGTPNYFPPSNRAEPQLVQYVMFSFIFDLRCKHDLKNDGCYRAKIVVSRRCFTSLQPSILHPSCRRVFGVGRLFLVWS